MSMAATLTSCLARRGIFRPAAGAGAGVIELKPAVIVAAASMPPIPLPVRPR